jgi:hypothetical protein
MSFAITSPITGAAQTGFTSPTYTVVSDMAPTPQGKQVAVSALGGTQAGVTTHTVSSPFTLNFVRPAVYKSLGKPNPTTGLIKDVPRNTYKFIGRKGVLPLAGQPYAIAQATLTLDIPAGSDTADAANIRGLLSALFGAVAQQSSGTGDTMVSGIV